MRKPGLYKATYTNADDNSFAEVVHIPGPRGNAVNVAKSYILNEHLRYSRDLNASIVRHDGSEKRPIKITLKQILESYEKTVRSHKS